jgi:hypothetical protein
MDLKTNQLSLSKPDLISEPPKNILLQAIDLGLLESDTIPTKTPLNNSSVFFDFNLPVSHLVESADLDYSELINRYELYRKCVKSLTNKSAKIHQYSIKSINKINELYKPLEPDNDKDIDIIQKHSLLLRIDKKTKKRKCLESVYNLLENQIEIYNSRIDKIHQFLY